MFEDLVEVDLKVTRIRDCKYGIPMVALIYGEYHGGVITTNCRNELVFEAGRRHYDGHHIERLWKVKGYIPKNIKKLIIENICNEEPFEYGKFILEDYKCWYFITDINTHTVHLIIPSCLIKGIINEDGVDFSGTKWNKLPNTEDTNYYSCNCSYTSIVLPSNIDYSNYSIECHKIINKICKQCHDYFETKKNKIIFTINGRNCGYMTTEVHYNDYGERWYSQLTVYLPIESNDLIQPRFLNKYIVDSYVTANWGRTRYDIRGMRFREFSFRGTKNEVINKLNESVNQITNELNSVSADDAHYILNNTGYYIISTDYLNKKPDFYKIELFIPIDETGLIRKDIINSDKIVLGEKLNEDWGWTKDGKFRYRSLELPNGNDYMKEIRVLG